MGKKHFKFDMIGLSKGDKIIFKPLELEVTISGPNTIEYEGKDWKLTTFVKEYIPHKKTSGTYQGPLYFSYKGRTLVDIRNEMDKEREENDW